MTIKNSTKYANDKHSQQNTSATFSAKFNKDDIADLARIGSEVLKKTVSQGIESLKEIKESLPKDTSAFLAKSKDDFIKQALAPEVVQVFAHACVDRFFKHIDKYKIELTLKVQKKDEKNNE